MLIRKGGITRNIDESHLHEYTVKGYEPFAEPAETDPPDSEKPVERMNTAELTQKAAELGVDISAATTNKQRAEAILTYFAQTAKE